ncbi:MAG TPA: hypothetical protein VD788_11800 [Candidatus Polarisedimenticolaceae bacterium]|nr:hypothetical protein [Candidatus Polarisedimenticolaceae bacterium]
MSAELTGDALERLVRTVFRPRSTDRRLALMFDLPDTVRPDHDEWADRRELVADWARKLARAGARLGLDSVDRVAYRNVRNNNADLPPEAWVVSGAEVPDDADRIASPATPMERILDGYELLIAVTELSATAPLKLAARRFGFRAATMPGFTRGMIPTLGLDWDEIHQRCVALAGRLSRATAAEVRLTAAGRACRLTIDLRHRSAAASGGLIREPGTVSNLPSGESYIVPYEGEIEGDPSRTSGVLPVRLDGELLFYRVEANRAVGVEGDGPVASREAAKVREEPAYANIAELGLGVLSEYGIRPVGRTLLDEKLALHIAFGRSDHFGGRVGAAQFSSPEQVVHVDRVYVPEMQPGIAVVGVDLIDDDGGEALIRDGRYV